MIAILFVFALAVVGAVAVALQLSDWHSDLTRWLRDRKRRQSEIELPRATWRRR